MTALFCLVKHFRCLNYTTVTAVSMLVLNIKILYYYCAAALEEGSSEEWETREGAWGVKRKGREGEGKVADPHQRKFLRRPLEYYWQFGPT